MKLPRFSIAKLMGFVLVSAIGLGGLMRPEEDLASLTFSMAVIILTFAVLNGMFGSGRSRAFWGGFAATGWIYAAFAFGNGFVTGQEEVGPPPLIFGALVEKLQVLIHPDMELFGRPVNLSTGRVLSAPTPLPALASLAPPKLAPATPPGSGPVGPAISGPRATTQGVDPTVLPATFTTSTPTVAPPPIAPAQVSVPANLFVPPAPAGGIPTMPGVPATILFRPFPSIAFQQTAQSLVALLAGLVGGYYAALLSRRKERATPAPGVPDLSPSSP